MEKSGKVFPLTHNYTGYPMVKLAQDIVTQGKIGKILKVIQYPRGWLVHPIEREGVKQAEWRTDREHQTPWKAAFDPHFFAGCSSVPMAVIPVFEPPFELETSGA